MAEHFILNRLYRFVVSVGVLALTTSCSWLSPYKMDINQGNYVTDDMLARLETGMTKDQVRYILGTSLLVDAFHPERWNYVYLFHKGDAKPEDDTRYRIVVVFDDVGHLERIEKPENLPAAVPAVMFRLDPSAKTVKSTDKDTVKSAETAIQQATEQLITPETSPKLVAPDSTPADAVAPDSTPVSPVVPSDESETSVDPKDSQTLPRFGSEGQMPTLPGIGDKTTRKIDALPSEEEVKAEIESMQGF